MNAPQTSALNRFTALLGSDVFFVPCETGTKRPLVTYVERPFATTQTPAYRAVFSASETNIDFDRDEDLATFLAANPRFAETTRSRGQH